jgi:hypothetical protein
MTLVEGLLVLTLALVPGLIGFIAGVWTCILRQRRSNRAFEAWKRENGYV